MSRKHDDSQLDFGLTEDQRTRAAAAAAAGPRHAATVVPFVDAATALARREAIQRVASSGIFALPPNLRVR